MAARESLDRNGAASLEAYLHERIPLTRSMEVSVVRSDDEVVVLEAPLEPNVNHRDTVFGGSASALAILAGWALVHVRLEERKDPAPRIVIQRNEMEYLSPVEGAFRARCAAPDPERWDRFVRTLDRMGKGRVGLEATVEADGRVVARFEGEYVALRKDEG